MTEPEPCEATEQFLAVSQERLDALADQLFTDPTIIDPTMKLVDEFRLARYVLSKYIRGNVPTLRYYRGDWFQWAGCWRPVDQQALTDTLYRLVKRYLLTETAKLPPVKGKAPAAPTFGKAALANVTMALQSLVSLAGKEVPGWIDGRGGRWIAFRDRLLNLDAWLADRVEVIEQTPEYFCANSLDYDCEFTDLEPTVLLDMLREQMSQSEIDCLQEFGGYALTNETDIQRAVYFNGPPRSGKGTIDRTIVATVGEHNCTSKSLKSFNSPHALEDVIGKTFLAISDQRSNDKISAEALERLLGIIGQDVQSVNPKNRPHFSARLDCKIMIVSNVMLDFEDDSGASLARFLFLATRKSYAGHEDPTLLKRILEQRNEVTWWFLRGLQRLLKNGRYTEPQNNLRQQFQYANAPVRSFVQERCELTGEVDKDALHAAFLSWCDEKQVGELEKTSFFKRLYATYSGIRGKRSGSRDDRSNLVTGISLTS